MNNDFWQSLARRLVTYTAGALVAHGLISSASVTQEDIEIVVSATMVFGTTIWTAYHQRKMKGTNETKVN